MKCHVCHRTIPKPGIVCEECYVDDLTMQIERLREEAAESLIKRVELLNAAYAREQGAYKTAEEHLDRADMMKKILRKYVDYLGVPPTGPHSYDSQWEDMYKEARAALEEKP